MTVSDGKASFPPTRRLRTTLHVGALAAAVATIALHLVAGARNQNLATLDQQQFITHLEVAISRGMIAGDIP